MVDFKIEGLEEFEKKLKTVEKKAPDRILKELDRQGNYLRRQARKNTPVKTGRLQRSYRVTKAEKQGKGYQKGLYNSDQKHHLVHNGHRKVSQSGRVLGWTNGLFYVDKTVAEEERKINAELQVWLGTLFEELK